MKFHWLATLAIFVSGTVHAADWTIGLGAGAGPQYEGSNDYGAVPLVRMRAQNLYHPVTYVNLVGTKLTSNFLAHYNIRAGISAEYVPERGQFNDIDNSRVDQLSDTDDGFLLGVVLGLEIKLDSKSVATLELDPRFDVSDNIGGLQQLPVRSHEADSIVCRFC